MTSECSKTGSGFYKRPLLLIFRLSNCINSGVDTVGVLTQYRHLRLNSHIGIGIPWDLDRNHGGVTLLPPYEKSESSDWYTGTANAIYQNMEYIRSNRSMYFGSSGYETYLQDGLVMLITIQKQKGRCDKLPACLYLG